MTHVNTDNFSCKDSSSFGSLLKRLLPTSSHTPQQITSKGPARLANVAAVLLVVASTGLGSYYAWSTGQHHGWFVGALFVCFAAGLELCKPLAVSAAFAAFRSWSIFRGFALVVLALVAVAYSLTAELSLMASSRSDVVAQREAVLKSASDAETTAKRAAERYDRAKKELTTLQAARPVGQIQAEVDALLLRPGANGCVVVDGKVTKEVCPKVAALRAEQAIAERRAELEQILAAPIPAAIVDASQPAVSKSDPAASALSAYLALLGFVVAPAVLSEWFVLVPVLALEIGSTLSVLLVQSVASPAGVAATRTLDKRKQEHHKPLVQEPMVPVVQGRNDSVSEQQPTVLAEVKSQILRQLEANGGSTFSSERALARSVTGSKPTVRRALESLVLAGSVSLEATRSGTLLRLV